jgi:uncharacterized protein (TIGR03084 family)
MRDIFDDLVEELDALEGVLRGLSPEQWESQSSAEGWTVADVVLHLAQTEEAVATTIDSEEQAPQWRQGGEVDEMVEVWVNAERAAGAEVFERWRVARRAAVDALRRADPQKKFVWARAPLKPATLATTRIAEHWAHALDIVDPLSIPYPDTDRLRHIAWLGHSTLPYAFELNDQEPRPVYVELTGPNGDTWRYGSPECESSITGAAGVFCRVGAHRLAPEAADLVTSGPHAMAALNVLRNYAG